MLTFDQIKTIYKIQEPANQKSRLQLVEYVQYELLDSIFKQKESEKLSFMGGTAIRIAYLGNRFSEDLDFDSFKLSFNGFQKILSLVVADMKTKGFDIEFRFIEKGAFHCYIRFPKILFSNSLSFHGNEKILVKVDAMKRSSRLSSEVFLINRFELYRNILVNSPSVILAEKLIAIRDRKRAKGRDFYDASFLYGMTEPDFKFMEKTVNIPKEKFMRQVLARCEKLNFDSLAKDVEPLLIKPEQIDRVRNFLEFWKTKI